MLLTRRCLQGVVIVDAEAFHHALDLVAAEHAHQVVFQRQVEAARTRVALAGGAAAQLVVDAAGFVAFGADDVQAAEFAHPFHVFENIAGNT